MDMEIAISYAREAAAAVVKFTCQKLKKMLGSARFLIGLVPSAE
jgi:hypothetical protein